MNKSIILMGIKHSGKSTQGRMLAKRCNCQFVDIDDVIVEVTGMTPRDIYNQKGVGFFMMMEEVACNRVVNSNQGKRLVIATGGGICDNPPALQALRSMGDFVFLNAPENIAATRILRKALQNPDGTWSNLPAYIASHNPTDKAQIINIFHEFYIARTSLYSQIADIIINLEDKSKEENAEIIAKALNTAYA